MKRKEKNRATESVRKTFSRMSPRPDNSHKVINLCRCWLQHVSVFQAMLHLISTFVRRYLSSPQPLSICRHRWRPALTGMTEAPLHTPSTSSSPSLFINPSSACLPLPPASRHLLHSHSAAHSLPHKSLPSLLPPLNFLQFTPLPPPRRLPSAPQSLGHFAVTLSGMWGEGLM